MQRRSFLASLPALIAAPLVSGAPSFTTSLPAIAPAYAFFPLQTTRVRVSHMLIDRWLFNTTTNELIVSPDLLESARRLLPRADFTA